MADLSLEQKLEGLLFYKGTPQKITSLCEVFAVSQGELNEAAARLTERLQSGATRLIMTNQELQLVLASEFDEFIESVRRDELKRDIGKAGAETLAIVLYRGPISRPEIDRIRGVNSAFILRNLLMRGLIERTQSGRTHEFDITPALLAHLGVTNKQSLPDHAAILDQIERFEAEAAKETES